MAGSWAKLIPVKVPLGARYNGVIPEHRRFTPQMLVTKLQEEGKQVGLVIDLTRSSQYYSKEEWLGVRCHKVPMQGRGAVPEPELVNHIFWLYLNFTLECPDLHIVMHCTHGFNRTGYVLVSLMLRLTQGLSVADAITHFARNRPPGIYKEDYIQSLFDYYHERRPSAMGPPAMPPWKDEDEDPPRPEDLEEEQAAAEVAVPPKMAHDDIIGESIDDDEAAQVQQEVMQFLLRRSPDDGRIMFPGSQPVSLARANLNMLRDRRGSYMVTWKADGTRYMLLLCKWGVYVIDRSFRIRRVQMRCIVPGPGRERHHMTLLDGEMVVDEDAKTGTCRRRYLAYDLMVLNHNVIANRPFKERSKMLMDYVIAPRDKERTQPGQRHLYDKEAFGLRHKTFWGLDMTQSLLTKFIQNLTHESDGLIFQPGDDPYVPATCEELLKWKFASMNSVDFLLQRTSTGGFQLCLLHSHGGGQTSLKPLADAKVIFPEGHELSEYVNRVIECSWDADASAWRYMRHRLDKEYPNAYHVYEKVLRSIQDNITEEELIEFVKQPQALQA